MFSVGVRDHVMIAHSFRGEVFGPAQRLHGATFVVDVEFRCAAIDDERHRRRHRPRARAAEGRRSAELNYRNLDELPAFAGPQHHHRVPGPPRLRARPRRHQGRPPRPGRRERDRPQGHAPREPRRLGRRSRTRSEVRAVALVHPGDLATRTGGYVYDRRAFAALAGAGLAGAPRGPARPVPVPGRGRPGRRRRGPGRASRRDGHGRRRPGAGRHAGGRRAPAGTASRLVALVHHPLCLETGLEPGRCRPARGRASVGPWPPAAA